MGQSLSGEQCLQMGSCLLFQGREQSIFPLVIASAVVSMLCFSTFLVEPLGARHFCIDGELLFISF